ncbi:MAG: hypothetical protein H0X52_02265 [Gemmatimonadetes bacterium]|nr:hypothetical protein [Gemmatimonadota bacterium]
MQNMLVATPHPDKGSTSIRRVWMLFSAGVVLLTLVQLPITLNFIFYAFEDLGGSLKLSRLLAEGYRPTLDFYYPYGLLPLLFGRLWFGLLGSSPWAYLAATLGCNLLLAWGLTRFVVAMRAGAAAVVFLLVTLDFVARPMYLNLTHAFEAALLVNALAEHARGRRGVALALLTICAFVKPSMAYIYGATLLALIVFDLARDGSSLDRWRRTLGPAMVTGVVLAVLLAAYFGVEALLHVQFPIKGAASYRYVNYGFFAEGRNFWNPADASLNYYLGTPAGLWIVATLVLVAGGAVAARKGLRQDGDEGGRLVGEIALSTLVMHVAFVGLFYGAAWDWIAYFFVLAMGVIAVTHRMRWGTPILALFAAMSLLGHKSSIEGYYRAWTTTAPSAITGGLWATPRQQAEWAHVLRLTQKSQPMLLSTSGAAEAQFPQFVGTGSFYIHQALVEPLMPAPEKERISSRLRSAPMVVVVRNSPADVEAIPRFRQSMASCHLAWRGTHFDVYHCDERRVGHGARA